NTDVLVDHGQEAEGADGDERALQQFEERDEADARIERAAHSTSSLPLRSLGKHRSGGHRETRAVVFTASEALAVLRLAPRTLRAGLQRAEARFTGERAPQGSRRGHAHLSRRRGPSSQRISSTTASVE